MSIFERQLDWYLCERAIHMALGSDPSVIRAIDAALNELRRALEVCQ